MPEENKQNNQLIAKPEDIRGNYANALQITVQDRDIVLDFISSVNIRGQVTSSLASRVFLNHFVAKELANMLNGVIAKWEEHKYSMPPEEGKKPDITHPNPPLH
jgi:Protein of unknown function (DUF3467)